MAVQVSYRGLWHFLRAKKWVAQAADLVASWPSAPPAVQIAPALRAFVAVTPGLSTADAQTYFLALISAQLAHTGRRVDALGMYMLDSALNALRHSRVAQGRGPAA